MFSSQLKHQEREKRKQWQRTAQIPLTGTVTKYPTYISIGKPVYSQSPFIMNDSLQRIILCTHHLLQETYYFGSELLVWLRDESNGFTSFVFQFETVEHKTGQERKQSRGGSRRKEMLKCRPDDKRTKGKEKWCRSIRVKRTEVGGVENGTYIEEGKRLEENV